MFLTECLFHHNYMGVQKVGLLVSINKDWLKELLLSTAHSEAIIYEKSIKYIVEDLRNKGQFINLILSSQGLYWCEQSSQWSTVIQLDRRRPRPNIITVQSKISYESFSSDASSDAISGSLYWSSFPAKKEGSAFWQDFGSSGGS